MPKENAPSRARHLVRGVFDFKEIAMLKKASEYLQPILDGLEDDGKISVMDGYLTLNYSYEYDIELSRIVTPQDIIGWVLHLSEKNWMTKERLRNFILKCAEANNTDYHCG